MWMWNSENLKNITKYKKLNNENQIIYIQALSSVWNTNRAATKFVQIEGTGILDFIATLLSVVLLKSSKWKYSSLQIKKYGFSFLYTFHQDYNILQASFYSVLNPFNYLMWRFVYLLMCLYIPSNKSIFACSYFYS